MILLAIAAERMAQLSAITIILITRIAKGFFSFLAFFPDSILKMDKRMINAIHTNSLVMLQIQ